MIMLNPRVLKLIFFSIRVTVVEPFRIKDEITSNVKTGQKSPWLGITYVYISYSLTFDGVNGALCFATCRRTYLFHRSTGGDGGI